MEGETKFQWLFLVPLKGGRWHSPSPNWQYIPLIYHLYIYILPSGALYATYHLLGEPETTLENSEYKRWRSKLLDKGRGGPDQISFGTQKASKA